MIVTLSLSITCLCAGIFRIRSKSRETQSSFLRYMLGFTMEPKFTSVVWEWTGPHIVGESMSFFLKVFCNVTVQSAFWTYHKISIPLPRVMESFFVLLPPPPTSPHLSRKSNLASLTLCREVWIFSRNTGLMFYLKKQTVDSKVV